MVAAARQKRIDAALSKALRLILAAQKLPKARQFKGGWRYSHNSRDSDISCTGWQLMALRSARNGGAAVPNEAIDRAVQYITGLRTPDGGFGYASAKGPGLGRTGTALLCLELSGKHGQKITRDAGEWILRNIGAASGPGGKRIIRDGHFFYATYYASQGMFQLGGRYWQQWAEVMYPTLLRTQRKNGSWAGRISESYSTAMAVLAMAVSYRQLPIYQR